MNGEQRVVYVRGMMLNAEITMQSMIAANQSAIYSGNDVVYSEKDFIDLIDKHGVHHNSLITELSEY